MKSILLNTTSTILWKLVLVFSIWVLFRGHNSPGGGFVAGLLSSGAFSLYFNIQGKHRFKQVIKKNIFMVLAFGFGLALLSGLSALFANKPFFTGIWWVIPYFNLDIGNPLFFDVGVYLVVVAAVVIILLSLGVE